jgi:hypothetical protein
MTGEDDRVIRQIAYREDHYTTSAHCVRGIRDSLALGWTLVEVRGGVDGPFLVLYRKDDAS